MLQARRLTHTLSVRLVAKRICTGRTDPGPGAATVRATFLLTPPPGAGATRSPAGPPRSADGSPHPSPGSRLDLPCSIRAGLPKPHSCRKNSVPPNPPCYPSRASLTAPQRPSRISALRLAAKQSAVRAMRERTLTYCRNKLGVNMPSGCSGTAWPGGREPTMVDARGSGEAQTAQFESPPGTVLVCKRVGTNARLGVRRPGVGTLPWSVLVPSHRPGPLSRAIRLRARISLLVGPNACCVADELAGPFLSETAGTRLQASRMSGLPLSAGGSGSARPPRFARMGNRDRIGIRAFESGSSVPSSSAQSMELFT